MSINFSKIRKLSYSNVRIIWFVLWTLQQAMPYPYDMYVGVFQDPVGAVVLVITLSMANKKIIFLLLKTFEFYYLYGNWVVSCISVSIYNYRLGYPVFYLFFTILSTLLLGILCLLIDACIIVLNRASRVIVISLVCLVNVVHLMEEIFKPTSPAFDSPIFGDLAFSTPRILRKTANINMFFFLERYFTLQLDILVELDYLIYLLRFKRLKILRIFHLLCKWMKF